MKQALQTTTKETAHIQIEQLVTENRALAFWYGVYAQEVSNAHNDLAEPTLAVAGWEMILQELSHQKTSKLHSSVVSSLLGKNEVVSRLPN